MKLLRHIKDKMLGPLTNLANILVLLEVMAKR